MEYLLPNCEKSSYQTFSFKEHFVTCSYRLGTPDLDFYTAESRWAVISLSVGKYTKRASKNTTNTSLHLDIVECPRNTRGKPLETSILSSRKLHRILFDLCVDTTDSDLSVVND